MRPVRELFGPSIGFAAAVRTQTTAETLLGLIGREPLVVARAFRLPAFLESVSDNGIPAVASDRGNDRMRSVDALSHSQKPSSDLRDRDLIGSDDAPPSTGNVRPITEDGAAARRHQP